MNNDPIQDYILESKDNLRIAMAVSDAWAEAGEKLVSGFFARLRARLEKALPGWDFDQWGGCYLTAADAGLDLWKREWREEYSVRLSLWDYGREVNFGVGRDADNAQVKKRLHCDKLLPALKAGHPSATSRKWWEAAVSMQSPASDWRQPEVLWRMHDEKDRFLEDVAEQLLEVAKISEPIIDEFVAAFAQRK